MSNVRPSVAIPPRRSKIKCLRESVVWLLLFHTVRSQPLLSQSLSSLSSLPLLSHTICRAPFCCLRQGAPKPGKLHVSCVTRCSSSAVVLVLANANARTKSDLVALACGYEKVEIVLGPGNCLAGNLELIRMDVAAQ